LAAMLVAPVFAQDARQIVAEAQKRSFSDSQRYEGVLEVVDQKNKVTTKRWAFERIGSYGDSKSVLRFLAPAEVKGVALLVHNHKDRASDQWMWRPAIERDQRIALQDRSTRFFGTDFSFEDLEERDVEQYDYKLLGEESMNGAPAWKLESTPKKTSQYAKSYLWVRKDNYTLQRIENYNKKGLIRTVVYSDFEKLSNIWTANKTEVTDHERNSRTIMRLEKLQYNVPLKEDNFTLQALRRAS
jgi:outer membrane lipoprotein-sorting protein